MITPRSVNMVLTMGLPRSGKSTWAVDQQRPIVNRDAIRLALHGETYLQAAEDWVTVLEDNMVRSLYLAGHSTVIIDACNLNNDYANRWNDFKVKGVHAIHIFREQFPASAVKCIERAHADLRPDLVPVIERMWERYGPSNKWIDRGGNV